LTDVDETFAELSEELLMGNANRLFSSDALLAAAAICDGVRLVSCDDELCKGVAVNERACEVVLVLAAGTEVVAANVVTLTKLVFTLDVCGAIVNKAMLLCWNGVGQIRTSIRTSKEKACKATTAKDGHDMYLTVDIVRLERKWGNRRAE
jgi:hypothetical protein